MKSGKWHMKDGMELSNQEKIRTLGKETYKYLGILEADTIKQVETKEEICCGLQIRPIEEQLKQRVIGKRYCINRKRRSYKGSTSRARLAVRLSNVS